MRPPPTPDPSKGNLILGLITSGAIAGIASFVVLRFVLGLTGTFAGFNVYDCPLIIVLAAGGGPLILGLIRKLIRAEFGSDLLAGLSIITSIILGEYLAGALVVLMLSGGGTLEAYAVRQASSVLGALAKRMPSIAHRQIDGRLEDVPLENVAASDTLVVLPNEICPVDGIVIAGHGSMDESYLTGEPYRMSKAPGSIVLSGSVNSETALTIRAEKQAVDSRYAKIMQVMRDSEQRRPRLRRLGDQLGAIYTPITVAVALTAWAVSGDSMRFLAVIVVATPCPLLIAIPIAIIGAVSLCAKRGIIIKDPAVLEKICTCRVAIFDKTGTLTVGRPNVTEIVALGGADSAEVLSLASSLEQYSKHPLAQAVVDAGRASGVAMRNVVDLSEMPGHGLRGRVDGCDVEITGRRQLQMERPDLSVGLPPEIGGLECIVLKNGRVAAVLHFHDQPRKDGESFIKHLAPKHQFQRVMIVSGDRDAEVRYLADRVGIGEVFSNQSPEQKLQIVRDETAKANVAFLGDGVNDAPALTAATVGIAFGRNSDITAEAAGAVIMESALSKVDELMHISIRLRSIALQSAVGGLTLSLVAMFFAAAGYLSPVAGAVLQEIIDVAAVLNALRMNWSPGRLTDF